MILAGLGMVIGNVIGAKLAEKLQPIMAVLITLVFMAVCLVLNTYLASDKVMVLVMTFVIGMVTFCLSTPISLAIINASKGAETLGSSLNQSAFNVGNAAGAYFAGLPIAMGYGYTSADWVGAGMAAFGVFIAFGIILYRNYRFKRKNKMKACYS